MASGGSTQTAVVAPGSSAVGNTEKTFQFCHCKTTCSRRSGKGTCPCRAANRRCGDACKCGRSPRKPCKNKIDSLPTRQETPLQQQVAELEEYIENLSTTDVKNLCCRLLCGRGGISLAKSILQTNFDSEHPTGEDQPSWCVCGNCREMETPTENVCCGVRRCATNFEHFFNICIDHMVLSVAIHNRADIRADPVDYSPASYRKAAYRQYILWTYGYLGRGNRRVMPSCVVLTIRGWYPSPTGVYLGFREY